MDHLTRASAGGDAAAVRRILDEDARSELPLIAACANGYYDVVSLLLSRGFNPNRKNEAGATPLFAALCSLCSFVSRRISPGETYASPPNSHNNTVMFVVLVPDSGPQAPDPRIRVVRALLSAGADVYGAVPHFGTPLRIVRQTPSPPLKLLVRRFLAHRMRATARHWWLPWPLACHVAGFLV